MNIKRLQFMGFEIIRYNLGHDEYAFRIPELEMDADSLIEAQNIIEAHQERQHEQNR